MSEFLPAKWFYRFLFNVFYFIILLMIIQHLHFTWFYFSFVCIAVVLLTLNAVWDYQDIINRVDEEVK